MDKHKDNIGGGSFWNLPERNYSNLPTVCWDFVASLYGKNELLDILEIGVHRARLLTWLTSQYDIQVSSYTGVDPYAGDETDPYTGAYWKDKEEADNVWNESNSIFEKHGHSLLRLYSQDYYSESEGSEWDVILVDGDHRYTEALWDFEHWFNRVKPNGIMIVDDYGNSDTPEVTRALNEFIRNNRHKILKSAYRVLPFQNKGKEIPISKTIVFLMRNEIS